MVPGARAVHLFAAHVSGTSVLRHGPPDRPRSDDLSSRCGRQTRPHRAPGI